MKTLDIILVSYNSEKWIEQCINSLKQVNYDLKNIYITFVDNNSNDNSLQILENLSSKNIFGGFQVLKLQYNSGFGPANNIGVKNTRQPYVFFLNIDTELEPNAISELMKAVEETDDQVALWEARQFPYEHPKLYDALTMETTWASAAACMVRRDYFETVGTFDDNIFMYAEDVDLSWRFRAHGYKTVYVPKCIVYHYTYEDVSKVKPNQFYNSILNNLMLRFKFGSLKDIIIGYLLYLNLFRHDGPSPDHRKILMKNFFGSFALGLKFRKWIRKNKKLNFKPTFLGWDYENIREGAFYINELPEEHPLVSIVVRTCGRPSVLRETLISLRNQTYSNIEVVIVEDGPDVSRKMIAEEFKDLNIVYHATEKNVGRCVAGNIGMDLAKGKYINFLDDDDLFYADHVEVLCAALVKNKGLKVAYSIAAQTAIQVISKVPYEYSVLNYKVVHKEKFNRVILFHHNYFPIQSVMFEKQIYEELGGFDKSLEVLEDWDLWLRYAIKYKFLFVEKLTSLYRVPAIPKEFKSRQVLFDELLTVVRNKHVDKTIEVSMKEIFNDVKEILDKPQSVIYRISLMSFKTVIVTIKRRIYSRIKSWLLSNK